MVYQDQIETHLLQLFAHPVNSEWFSVVCAIIFEVNSVDTETSIICNKFFVFLQVSIALNSFSTHTALPLFRCACSSFTKSMNYS